jgi:hypothetical protein
VEARKLPAGPTLRQRKGGCWIRLRHPNERKIESAHFGAIPEAAVVGSGEYTAVRSVTGAWNWVVTSSDTSREERPCQHRQPTSLASTCTIAAARGHQV